MLINPIYYRARTDKTFIAPLILQLQWCHKLKTQLIFDFFLNYTFTISAIRSAIIKDPCFSIISLNRTSDSQKAFFFSDSATDKVLFTFVFKTGKQWWRLHFKHRIWIRCHTFNLSFSCLSTKHWRYASLSQFQFLVQFVHEGWKG